MTFVLVIGLINIIRFNLGFTYSEYCPEGSFKIALKRFLSLQLTKGTMQFGENSEL